MKQMTFGAATDENLMPVREDRTQVETSIGKNSRDAMITDVGNKLKRCDYQ